MKNPRNEAHSSPRRRWCGDPAKQNALFVQLIFVSSILCFSMGFAFAQPKTVSGKISSDAGDGIPGVNVLVKGTSRGTATDLDGRYTIGVEESSETVLVISAVGFDTQEIGIGQRSIVDIQLKSNLIQLDEVVVTGYSTLMKKDVSSSIAVVDVDEMKKVAASNFADQLQGKVAGVQVATSGDPGSFQYVRVRGIGTINNNEPLYVIDGVPVQNETNMNFLNPNDIESMQVLKDAAAASIYGARAANGVIVITTHRGKGKSKLKFDFFTGVQNPQNFPEVANPSELLEIQQGLYAGAGEPFNSQFYVKDGAGNWVLPDFMVGNRGYVAGDDAVDPSRYVLNTTDAASFGNNYPIAEVSKEGTNWFKEIFQPAAMTSAQISASGGDEKGSHYLSFNYFKHDGLLLGNDWQRFQTRLNSDFFVGKNLRVGENLNIAYQTRTGQNYFGFDIRKAYFDPTVPVHDIMGYWATNTVGPNPIADQTRWADGIDGHNLRLTGNAFAEFDFLKSFTIKTNFGLDYNQIPRNRFLYNCPECRTTYENNLEKNSGFNRNWVFSTTLNFERSFRDHRLYAVAGVETRDAYVENFAVQGAGLVFGNDPNFRELTNAQSGSYQVISSRSNSRMASVFLNANYTFREKYIVAATVRSDGSSRFLNNKFGIFPGLSAAWRMSEESFLMGADFLTELKLRASWGITGNNEVVGGDYPGYSNYGASLSYSSYPIDGNKSGVSQGFAQLSYGNPDLRWESSILTNLGFDATLMKNLDVTIEWYSRKTEDMIYGASLPLEKGVIMPVNGNVGSMTNVGIDGQLTYRGRALSQKLAYTIGLTGTHYSNKVEMLADSTSIIVGPPPFLRTQAGYPVSQFYGFIAEGLWQSQEQIDQVLFDDPGSAKPGRMKFKDINEDGKINDDDRTFIGSPIPKFILGLNSSFAYKNFDLTAYISGVFGNKVYNYIKGSADFYYTETGGNLTPTKRMLYEAGKSLPVLDFKDQTSGSSSSYWVEDGSFLRVRNITLGYTLPEKILSKSGISKLRTYFQVQNAFTWTKYSGMDPDVTIVNMVDGNQQKRDLETGIDLGHYPTPVQFIIGFNIEL